jgi:hypothetical protein
MSSPRLEAFLARLYADEHARHAFLSNPHSSAAAAGLDADEVAALVAVDRDGLIMAARSFEAKRRGHRRHRLMRWSGLPGSPISKIIARGRLFMRRR